MTDELEAIRARHEAAESDGRFPWLPDDLSWQEDYGQAAHRDRATLLRLLDAAREELAEDENWREAMRVVIEALSFRQ